MGKARVRVGVRVQAEALGEEVVQAAMAAAAAAAVTWEAEAVTWVAAASAADTWEVEASAEATQAGLEVLEAEASTTVAASDRVQDSHTATSCQHHNTTQHDTTPNSTHVHDTTRLAHPTTTAARR